jgi:hypothetical protein
MIHYKAVTDLPMFVDLLESLQNTGRCPTATWPHAEVELRLTLQGLGSAGACVIVADTEAGLFEDVTPIDAASIPRIAELLRLLADKMEGGEK